MKVKFIMALFFFGLAISGLRAQTMYVRPNAGAQSSYAIANIKNLTFSGGNLVVTNLTGANGTFSLSGNRYLNFTNLTLANTVVNLCKGTTPTPLTIPSGNALKWYTVTGTTTTPIYTLIATGAPSPLTTTVASPSKVYAVSEVLSTGVESAKFKITVNVLASPTTPTTLIGTAAQGALVGTNTLATYSTTAVVGATSYLWTVPAGVSILSGQGTTSITVNFNGVSAGAGAIGPISVQSVNANGCSSLAKSLTLTKALPAAPAAIKMTDALLPIPTSGIPKVLTSFAEYMGTSRILTLTATPSLTATSYVWELPNGATQLSGGTSNVITVNFLGVTSSNSFNYATTATNPVSTNVLRIGVKARNGVGDSTTSNAALVNPTTTSTAKLITLKAVKPATVSAVAGQIAGLCGGSTYSYTITGSALASSYTVTAPAGSVVTFTGTLTFTVTYPAGFVVTTATTVPNKSLVVTSVNGVGSSATNKTLTLSTAMAAIATVSGGTTYSSCNQTFSASAVVGASSYTWTVPSGASIVSGQGTSSVLVNYGTLTGSQPIKVVAANGCGVSSALKSVTLRAGACSVAKQATTSNVPTEVSIYPNPAREYFNIELNAATKGQMEITIFSMSGAVISSRNIQLTKGNNVINENVSSLTTGIYFVKFTNIVSNETSIKKLIKE